jgi:hypothetical protein
MPSKPSWHAWRNTTSPGCKLNHIAEAVSGRSKDWIKMKNPAAKEMVVKKAEKTRTHFIFRTEHLAALGTFRLA